MSRIVDDPNNPFSSIPPEEIEAKREQAEEKAAENGREPGTAIVAHTLSGLALDTSGQIKKSSSKYLPLLRNTLDDYTDMVLTPEEIRRLQLQMANFKTGSAATIPILCAGPQCPFAARCPFEQMGKAPIGRQCIWEINLMKQWALSWLEEYEVDPENLTEMTLINDLVEIELRLHRINLSAASDVDQAIGVVDVNIGMDNNGNVITQKQISQLQELRDRLLNRKQKIIKLLVGDRQEKYKKEAALKQRETKDPSSNMALLREQMTSLQTKLEQLGDPETTIAGKATSVEMTESEKDEQDEHAQRATPLTPDDIIFSDDE